MVTSNTCITIIASVSVLVLLGCAFSWAFLKVLMIFVLNGLCSRAEYKNMILLLYYL